MAAEKKTRKESDSMGEIEVPAEHLWGAQTQRSLIHFSIGDDRMPKAVYHAYGYIKKATALVNAEARLLPQWKADLIIAAADEVIEGKLDEEFPLYVWQTGSGTQSNMNINEVISNRAILLHGGVLGAKDPIHPNDDVNQGQSSNDTFPTAMHIATVREFVGHLIPEISSLKDEIWNKAREWANVIKIGRTHLQDATPLTVGQEWSGYATQLESAIAQLQHSLEELYKLAIGGTAVGTGLNAPPNFDKQVTAKIAQLTGLPFVSATNKFAAQGSLDAMVAASAALRQLAVCLMKMANDIRWLGSGPRAGLHELVLPENEPGSSIMPGKVNPTQEEALVMVCIQVIGEDTAVAIAGSQGNFELNAMRPIIINNVLHCARILRDAVSKWHRHSVSGIRLDKRRIQNNVEGSLMLVTALVPIIGYDQASAIAHQALERNITLREAAVGGGFISESEFDRIVVPQKMVGEPSHDVRLK